MSLVRRWKRNSNTRTNCVQRLLKARTRVQTRRIVHRQQKMLTVEMCRGRLRSHYQRILTPISRSALFACHLFTCVPHVVAMSVFLFFRIGGDGCHCALCSQILVTNIDCQHLLQAKGSLRCRVTHHTDPHQLLQFLNNGSWKTSNVTRINPSHRNKQSRV